MHSLVTLPAKRRSKPRLHNSKVIVLPLQSEPSLRMMALMTECFSTTASPTVTSIEKFNINMNVTYFSQPITDPQREDVTGKTSTEITGELVVKAFGDDTGIY